MSDTIVFPLVRGDYIIRKYDNRIAKVRTIWWDEHEKQFLANLTILAFTGHDMKRQSPAEGGPKAFEPAIPIDEFWERIEDPEWPVRIVHKWVDNGKGVSSLVDVPSVTAIPFRKHVRRTKTARPAATTKTSDFDPELEANSLRLAASRLRDIAREMPETAVELKKRANDMDAEAEKLWPRGRG